MVGDLFGNEVFEPIKALAWNQPFASLMLYGKIETRTWHTNVRGRVLIYSSKHPYEESQLYLDCGKKLVEKIQYTLKDEPTAQLMGYAIAIGRLVDCRPMTFNDEEQAFIRYHESRWCHIYEDVKRIESFPYLKRDGRSAGGQGWKDITDPFILKQIKIIT